MEKLTHPGIPSLKPKGRRLQPETNSLLNSLPGKGKGTTIKATKAFTLVELIVVITILAILGMIAFISLQGYSADARDSSRISDVNHIKTSLELQSLAAGKYPMPDTPQSVTYSGGTVITWYQGTVGENVTKILSRNLNEKPTDPLYNTEYIYSVTPTQNQFEVMSIYEGDMVYNIKHPSPQPSPFGGEGVIAFLGQVNASSNTVRIDGTYNGLYVKNGNYIIPTPSIITSLNPTGLDLNTTTLKSQVIDRGTNIPNIGTSKIAQSTGALTFSNFEVYNGELNEESSTGEFLSAYQAIANTYNGSSLASEGVIKTLLTQTTDDQKIEFTKSLILSTPTGSTNGGETPVTYSCIGTLPTQNVLTSNATGLTSDISRQNTASGDKCYYECTNGYSGSDCLTYTHWKDIAGTSCTNDDYIFTFEGTTYRWAGCNSVLGTTGITTNSNVYNGACYNYAGNLTSTNCNSTYLTYTAKENVYNSTYGEDNIWGKLYFRANAVQANNACPTGWHLPTNLEFEKLQTYLNGGVTCPASADDWICDGLGFSGKSSKTTSNNLVKALKIPLTGHRDNGAFYARGDYTFLWTSTESDSNNVRGRHLIWNKTTIYNGIWPKTNLGFGVRCVKD